MEMQTHIPSAYASACPSENYKEGACSQIVCLCLSSLTPSRIAPHGESQVSISTTALLLIPNGGDEVMTYEYIDLKSFIF